MDPDSQIVTSHYAQPDVLGSIRAGLQQLGIEPDAATIRDLAPVDEFHVGGRPATAQLCQSLGITASDRVLDVGCGIGGLARYIGVEIGATVVGVDLTSEYIEAAQAMTGWIGVADRVDFVVGSADTLPTEGPFAEPFDVATLLHVGMNIADKAKAFVAVADSLRPGGRFGIYDNLRCGPGDLTFPVPWATQASTSYVEDAAAYLTALDAAGFEVESVTDRSDDAKAFFAKLRERSAAAKQSPKESSSPPPLGLHLLMGPDAGAKTANLFAAITGGVVAPTEIIARKR